jgi:hypothetical protein
MSEEHLRLALEDCVCMLTSLRGSVGDEEGAIRQQIADAEAALNESAVRECIGGCGGLTTRAGRVCDACTLRLRLLTTGAK